MSDNLFMQLARQRLADDELVGAWFALVGGFTAIERELRRALQEPHGLSLPRFDTLSALKLKSNGLTMTDLAELLVVTKGNVTGVVRRLEAEGLVEKSTAKLDKRVQRVRITEAGKCKWGKLDAVYRKVIAGLLGDLEEAELQSIATIMLRLKLPATDSADQS